MSTANDIIRMALKDCGALGVGRAASAEDLSDAFTRLNWMLGQWQRKRWFIWHLVDVSVVSTGAQSYSVGPGGDIDVAVRPSRLEAAYVRQINQETEPNQVDYPLTIIQSYENYSMIGIKQLTSFPDAIFYDSAQPVGLIYPWPIPNAGQYEVHIIITDLLNQFTDPNAQVALPEEYLAAIHFNLTVRLFPAYGLPPRADIVGLAKDSLNVLRQANTQIGILSMPLSLSRAGIYNPYSDRVY